MKMHVTALIVISALLAASCKPEEKHYYPAPPVVTPSDNTPSGGGDNQGEDNQGGEQTTKPDVPFTNPVRTAGAWADPTIWQADGKYYSIATGNNTIWQSTDLVTWTQSQYTARTSAANNSAKAYGKDFWAPDVIKIGNTWNMYLSIRNSAEDSHIGVFTSQYPTGPYNWVGIVTNGNVTGIKDTIDPEVVIDPDTGKVWLFFGSVGKMHRVELNSTGTAVVEGATYTHVAGLDVSQNSSRSKVYEGCYLHKHGDWWYLFASAGNYSNYTYKIVVGRSATLTGEFLDRNGKKMTEGNATDVMVSADGDEFYGPGHNGEIFTDSTGQDYILYHCHKDIIDPAKPENVDTKKRYLMLQRIFWDENGWPYVQDGKPAATDIAPKF